MANEESLSSSMVRGGMADLVEDAFWRERKRERKARDRIGGNIFLRISVFVLIS
tara:strand:+ start:373 stop:534 length:162 start_codon:yes stop_codon:yes gene_type:complete